MPVARLNLLTEKLSRFFELSSEFEFWGSFSSNVKVNPVWSWKGQISFQQYFPPYSQHFTTLLFLRNVRILPNLKQLSRKNYRHKRSENLPFSRNLVTADRKRRGKGRVMWTKDHERLDANHVGSIWFRVRQRIALSWGSKGCRKVTLMPHPLKCPPKASLGSFPFEVWKTEGVEFMNPLHSPEERTQ